LTVLTVTNLADVLPVEVVLPAFADFPTAEAELPSFLTAYPFAAAA